MLLLSAAFTAAVLVLLSCWIHGRLYDIAIQNMELCKNSEAQLATGFINTVYKNTDKMQRVRNIQEDVEETLSNQSKPDNVT